MAKKNKNNSNRQNIQHYQKVVRDHILAGKPIYNEPRKKGEVAEELILDEEEKKHPETEFQSIYKKDDPVRKDFFDARNYFLSKHGDRGHLIRVSTTEKGDNVIWVKEDSEGRERPQYHISYVKNGKTTSHGISTYDLMAIVYGEINAFGLAEDLLKSNVFKALGRETGEVRGHHKNKWDPEEPDDPNGIQFITTALDYFIDHPLDPDASDEEQIAYNEAFANALKNEIQEDNTLLGLEMPMDEASKKIEAYKGKYIKIKPSGGLVGALFYDENGDVENITFDLKSKYTNMPELDEIINAMKPLENKIVHITFPDKEVRTIRIFKV